MSGQIPAGPFDVVVADPPWMYQKRPGQFGDGDGASGIAEREYPTMTNEEIAAIPIQGSVAKDAHLFMWVTNPGMFGGRFSDVSPAAIADAWGFEFRTMLTWVKTVRDGRIDRGGMGWYFRGATEHVLYATRGAAGIPAELREPNVFMAAKRGHSQKPAEFFRLVERVTPDATRLEMFARQPRAGWTTWGNEADGSRILAPSAEQTDGQLDLLEGIA